MEYISNGILLGHKKEWNNVICSNMGGPRDYHTKQSESEKERQISIISLQVEPKILYKLFYLQIRNRVTDVANKHDYERGNGERGKLGYWDWHIHTTIYKIDN